MRKSCNGEKKTGKRGKKQWKKEKKNDENSGHYIIDSSWPPERRMLERRTLECRTLERRTLVPLKTFFVASNVIASWPVKRGLTGTPITSAKIKHIFFSSIFVVLDRKVPSANNFVICGPGA